MDLTDGCGDGCQNDCRDDCSMVLDLSVSSPEVNSNYRQSNEQTRSKDSEDMIEDVIEDIELHVLLASLVSRPELLISKHGRFNDDNERSSYFDVKAPNRASKLPNIDASKNLS